MEDRHSGDCEHPHSSPDGTGYNQLHGPRPNRNLNEQSLRLNTTRGLTEILSALFCFIQNASGFSHFARFVCLYNK